MAGMTKEKQRALALARARFAADQGDRNADGTYGQPPEGFVLNPRTGQMEDVTSPNNPNIRGGRGRAIAQGAGQGVSFGAMDEVVGGMMAAVPGDGTPKQRYEYGTAVMREELDRARENYPVETFASEVGASMTVPIGAAKTVAGAARVGAATGAGYAAGSAEGGVKERLTAAAKAAPTGALFGATLAMAQKGVSAGWRRAFNKTVKRPSVEALKAVKNNAYSAVDRSGEVFTPDEMKGLYTQVRAALDNSNYVEEVDRQTFAALKLLEKASEKNVTLGQLDKIRQGLWKRFGAADNEVGILDAIQAVDDLIETRAGSSALMDAARAANSRYSKAQLLDDAFTKARLQTESTGSGGNILNKYRQAVTGIITNPKKAKWFSEDELALMEHFVEGDLSENMLRRIGKLAPGGNGLMQALNLVAASVDPTFLAASGAAQAAKFSADRGAMQGAEAIKDAVATGVIRQPRVQDYRQAGRAGGVSGAAATRD